MAVVEDIVVVEMDSRAVVEDNTAAVPAIEGSQFAVAAPME